MLGQIKRHGVIIMDSLAMEKYRFDRNNRVVVLFEKKRTQLAVMDRLQGMDEFIDLRNYFIFKNLEEPEKLRPESFYDGRVNIQGEQVGLY